MINKFFYRKGGSEAYMFDLIDLLKKNNQQVIEFSMHDEKNQPSPYANYFIKNIDFNKREGFLKDFTKALHLIYSFEARNKLEALIKKEKPDIAHLHNFNFQLTPSILGVLKKYKIPVVWTMHDYHLICPNYSLFTQGQICERCKVHKYYNCYKYKCIKNNRAMSFLAMLEMYLHKLVLRSYKKINLFISPSQFLKNKINEGWQVETDKIKQLYNFVDLAKFKPNFEAGEGLLYVGRLSREKGLITLLKAMQALPEITLNIVGTGPQKQEILQFIADNNLNNINLLGYKTGEELYDLIRQTRFVVLPSIWYENNPISVLESFALAKPVIGSDLGGIPELVKNGQTGYLFAPGDYKDLESKIKAVYSDLETSQKLGKNAREFVEKMASPEAHLAQILEIYKGLIS